MITHFKLFENTHYKDQLTSSELIDFIFDNNLRDWEGELDYNGARDISYSSESGFWNLQELTDLNKDRFDFLHNSNTKTLSIPIIRSHHSDNT